MADAKRSGRVSFCGPRCWGSTPNLQCEQNITQHHLRKNMYKILSRIGNLFAYRRRRTALRDFEKKWGYRLQGNDYLTIGEAGIVSEYGYLIRYITENLNGGAIEDFRDYERIAKNFSFIDFCIATELQTDMPRETKLTSLETARSNLMNLQLIVHCLTAYVEMAREVGLPLNPMKS
jgi:hypothetical protein